MIYTLDYRLFFQTNVYFATIYYVVFFLIKVQFVLILILIILVSNYLFQDHYEEMKIQLR